jgi:hypothetical protein
MEVFMESHLEKNAKGGDLTVKSALMAGFSFIKHVDNDMVKMLGIYFVISCILGLLGTFFLPDPSQQASPVMRIIINFVLGPLAALPLSLYVAQKVILDKEPGAYLGYYMHSTLWRLVGASALMVVIFGIPLGMMMFGAILMMAKSSLSLALVGISAVLLIVSIYLILRLSLITPHVAVHNKISLKYVFHLSKGLVLKILAITLFSVIPLILVSFLLLSFGLTGAHIPHVAQGADQVLAQGVQQGMNLGGGLVMALTQVIATTILAYLGFIPGAAIAHFYKEVVKERGENIL